MANKSALTVKVGVESVPQVGAGAEVDELELEGLEVDQQVLVLDVPVDDALPVAGDHRLDDLPEEVPRELLLEEALLGDEVEEVLAGLGPLHDDDVGVVALEAVDQLDHAGHPAAGDHVHEAHLQRDTLPAHLGERKENRNDVTFLIFDFFFSVDKGFVSIVPSPTRAANGWDRYFFLSRIYTSLIVVDV